VVVVVVVVVVASEDRQISEQLPNFLLETNLPQHLGIALEETTNFSLVVYSFYNSPQCADFW
jgi:hypothetical protein